MRVYPVQEHSFGEYSYRVSTPCVRTLYLWALYTILPLKPKGSKISDMIVDVKDYILIADMNDFEILPDPVYFLKLPG